MSVIEPLRDTVCCKVFAISLLHTRFQIIRMDEQCIVYGYDNYLSCMSYF